MSADSHGKHNSSEAEVTKIMKPHKPEAKRMKPHRPEAEVMTPLKPEVKAVQVMKPRKPKAKAVNQNKPEAGAVKQDESKSEVAKQNKPEAGAVKQDESKSEVAKQNKPEAGAVKQDESKSEVAKQNKPEAGAVKQDESKSEVAKQNKPEAEAVKQDEPEAEPSETGNSPVESLINEGSEEITHQEDMEYISDTNAAVLMKTPKGGRLLVYAALLALLVAIVWANLSSLDELTRGTGIVIPSSRLQVVQNLEGGILKKVFVKEGEHVRSGQPLMQLDDTNFSSSFREGAIEYFSELAKAARLSAELSGGELSFPEELNDYPAYVNREKEIFKRRADSFNAELSIADEQVTQVHHDLMSAQDQLTFLKKGFALGQEELELTIPLAKQGVVSKVELIQLRQRVNDLESEMRGTELNIPKLQAVYQESLANKEEIVKKYHSEIAQELKKTEVDLDRLSESNHALEDKVDRTLVRSPMDGIVKKIYVTTIGGIVQPGMSMLEIVPLNDNLLIEAQIQPKDIGFLRKGMRSMVKLTAYDFGIYGGLEGEVENISADTIKDEKGESFYIVRIRTKRNFLGTEEKPLLIIPGMRTNVDIITGKKTIMDYLLKPILKSKRNALTER